MSIVDHGWDALDRQLYAIDATEGADDHACPDESCPWHPLERFAQLAARAGSVHLYKHEDTRRYINLDDAGHAYEYQPGPTSSSAGTYVPLPSPADAIARCHQ